MKLIRNLLEGLGPPKYLNYEYYAVSFNLDVPRKERLRKAGFDCITDEIHWLPSPLRGGWVEAHVELLWPRKCIRLSALESYFLQMARDPVGLDALIALATDFPLLQRYFPIAAAGNALEGCLVSPKIPFVGILEGSRVLGVRDEQDMAGDHFRFAVVKPKTSLSAAEPRKSFFN